MIQIDIYLKEISDFLQTVTIKNNTFAEIMKVDAIEKLDVETLSDMENPYYLNLIGEYSPLDEPMYITSLDTYNKILFSKGNLASHNKTRTAYNITSDFYKKLCLTYPLQTDLIKSIRYPVASITDAISADDFEILNYDTSMLEPQEVDSIVTCLRNTVLMIKERWYIKEFNYQEFYPIILWCVMWYQLNLSLLLQRVRNLRTSEVHSYHIAEYLSSKGLSQYLPFLTSTQRLFLYQNINYLLQNRGKQSNFDILITKLFTEIGGALDNKTIYLSKENSVNTLKLIPKIVTEQYNTGVLQQTYIDSSNINSLYNFEHILKNYPTVEPYVDDDFIESQSNKLAIQPTTCIPTKFLEMSETNTIGDFDNIMKSFIADSYLYLIGTGHVNTVSTLESSYFNDIVLNSSESIALINYCMRKMDGLSNVETIPIVYSTPLAFKAVTPIEISDLDLKFVYDNDTYILTDYIDVKNVLLKLYNHNRSCVTSEEFVELMLSQISIIYDYFNISCRSADMLVTEAMYHLFKQLFVSEYNQVTLIPGCTTYTEWFTLRDSVSKLVIAVEGAIGDEYEKWSELAILVSNTAFSIDPRLFAKYGNVADANVAVNMIGLKDLLVYLSSYNINILDKPYNKNYWLSLFNKKYYSKGINHVTDNNYIRHEHTFDLSLNLIDYQNNLVINNTVTHNYNHVSEIETDSLTDINTLGETDNKTSINYRLDTEFVFDFSDLLP